MPPIIAPSAALDFLHLASSLVDIATDVAVTMRYRDAGRHAMFWASLGIFSVANMFYAFMFTASYAPRGGRSGGERWKDKVWMFLWITPIAQLLPILIFVDFHYPGFIKRWILGKGRPYGTLMRRAWRNLRSVVRAMSRKCRTARGRGERALAQGWRVFRGRLAHPVEKDARENEERMSSLFSQFIETENEREEEDDDDFACVMPDEHHVEPDDEDDMTIIKFVQKKLGKHAGFFAESLVEALPQAILQLIGIMVYGFEEGSTALFLFSIFLSIFVIVSKGYILAFSVHKPTFVFNTACAVFDVVGCFATFIFIFSSHRRDAAFWSTDAIDNDTTSRTMDLVVLNVYWIWLTAFTWTVRGVALFGLALVTFSNADDHLKILSYERDSPAAFRVRVDSPVFDFWVQRTFLYALLVVPVSMYILILKAFAIPIYYFGTVDETQFRFPVVHEAIVKAIYEPTQYLKVAHLVPMKCEADLVREREIKLKIFNHVCYSIEMRYDSSPSRGLFKIAAEAAERGGKPADVADKDENESMMTRWLAQLGRIDTMPRDPNKTAVVDQYPENNTSNRATGSNNNNNGSTTAEASYRGIPTFDPPTTYMTAKQVAIMQARERRRPFLRNFRPLEWLEENTDIVEEMTRRSKVVAFALEGVSGLMVNTQQLCLFTLGAISLVLTESVLALIVAPSVAVLTVASILVPILGSVRAGLMWFFLTTTTTTSPRDARVDDEWMTVQWIGICLTAVYGVCMMLLLVTWKRTDDRRRLVNERFVFPSHLGDNFMKCVVPYILPEVEHRYRKDAGRRKVRYFLDSKITPDATDLVYAYVVNRAENIYVT